MEIDRARGFLGRDVAPNESARVVVRVRAPQLPGLYRLAFDPVVEGLTWFADAGSTPAHCYLAVSGDRQAGLDSRDDGLFSARMTIVRERLPGRYVLSIENAGNLTWLSKPLHQGGWVRLGLQTVTTQGVLNRDWRRLDLPKDVSPGEVLTLEVDLRDVPPSTTAVRMDLVSELKTWFEDRGSKALVHTVDASGLGS